MTIKYLAPGQELKQQKLSSGIAWGIIKGFFGISFIIAILWFVILVVLFG